VLSKEVTEADGDVVREATLRVTHAAGQGDRLKVLRRLQDPGTRNCDVDYGLDFVPDSVRVSDRDGNGIGDASVAWWASCRGDPGPYTVKVAVVTNGLYYILRGEGQRRSDPPVPGGVDVPAATFKPAPSKAGWPRNMYQDAVAEFNELFR
jgi:hypothetical protein